MRTTLLTATVALSGWVGAICAVSDVKASDTTVATPNTIGTIVPAKAAAGAPVIQFETNFFDFGKLHVPGLIAGEFKFKNAGTGVLKVDPPHPSCGCTVAKVIPDTLVPGEQGVISYTINLDHAMQGVQKHIAVHSNDPQTPDVRLTMQMDYSPLYEFSPKLLPLKLPAGKNEVQGTTTIVRGDGQPLEIQRLTTSQPWLSADVDPSFKPGMTSAQVNVTVRRPDRPMPILAGNVELWADLETNKPMQTLLLTCQIQGQLSATPSQMYWVIPNRGKSITNYSSVALTRTVKLKSASGRPVGIGRITTGIKGLGAQVVTNADGQTEDLILKFHELPDGFTSGNVIVETSPISLPNLEVPVTVSVPR